MHGASECADLVRSYACLKPKLITDRDRNLTDTQSFRVCQSNVRKLRSVDANNREIGIRVVADELGAKFPAVGKIDFNFVRAMHDVAVGQNKTVRRNDESGTAAAA